MKRTCALSLFALLAAPAVSMADTYCTRQMVPEGINCRHTFYVYGNGSWVEMTECNNPGGGTYSSGWTTGSGSAPNQGSYDCMYMG